MLIAKFGGGGLEPRIAALEQTYGIVFSEEYRTFLLQYNGGFTPKTRFKKGKISSDLRGFYGIGGVKLSLDRLDLKEWVSSGVWPVACDSFGNYIVLGLTDGGRIYFWDHEAAGSRTQLEDSLSRFLACCKSERISEKAGRSIQEREADLIARGRGGVITDALRKMWQDELDKYGGMVQEEVVLAKKP